MKSTALHRAQARSSASFPAHIVDELRRYDEHLRDVRGLATETHKGRLHVVGLLLQGKFKARVIELGKLHPDDIRQFLAMQSGIRCSTSHVSHLAAALRSYLRYRATCGDEVGKLTAVILNPVHWKLASLPRALKPEDVEHLLNSFAAVWRLCLQRHSRHTTAMHLLQAGVDISVIALWLGHESPVTTHHYVEADLTMKERALARLHEPEAKIQRYRAPDSLLDFLKSL